MDVSNKLCIVTCANSGIGKETVRAFARQGAYVLMICRNESRAQAARDEISDETGHSGLEIIIADLALQHDIRNAAEQIKNQYERIDILVNNAGFIPSERNLTADGIEKTLAVNHLAPFLLTNLLLKPLKKAIGARIVTVSSEVHRLGARIFDLNNLQLTNGFTPMKAYGLSKLCNILFTRELATRLQETSVTANCLHPGLVNTGLSEEAGWLTKLLYLVGGPFMRSPEKGAQTSIYVALSNEVKNTSGKYFKNKQQAQPTEIVFDQYLMSELWERSKELTGLA